MATSTSKYLFTTICLAQVIELFIIHKLVLSEPWFTLVIACDDGWLELVAVCRLSFRACVALTGSSGGGTQIQQDQCAQKPQRGPVAEL